MASIIPPCNDAKSHKPCWYLTPNLMNCTTTDHHLELKIERATAPAPETHVIANCVTAAN